MGDILDYGKEDVLKFIQSTIKNNNNVKHDILDKIKYVLGEVIEGDVIESCINEYTKSPKEFETSCFNGEYII